MTDKKVSELSPGQKQIFQETRPIIREAQKEGVQFVREQFQDFLPLFEMLQSDPTFATELRYVLSGPHRERFLKTFPVPIPKNPDDLMQGEDDVRVVDKLSIFNPYIAAAILTDRPLFREFLLHSLQKESEARKEDLDGKYLPIVCLGASVHSTTSIGIILENAAELSPYVWTFDLADQPGGPFGEVLGKAFRVNSANLGGDRSSPGQRMDDKRGDINTIVDFLAGMPDLTGDRYPDNELFWITIATQLKLICKNIVLGTEIKRIRRNTDKQNGEGIYRLTLQYSMADGSRKTAIVTTDALIGAIGIGERFFGLDMSDPETAEIINEELAKQKNGDQSQLYTTLDALKRFGDKRKPFPLSELEGKSGVIIADKDSAKIVLEFLAGIGGLDRGFSVAMLSALEKIRIIGKDVARTCEEYIAQNRTRYAGVGELFDRASKTIRGKVIPGRSGLVSGIRGNAEKLRRAVDGSGRLVVLTDNGESIAGDFVISAAGFRNKVANLFTDFYPQELLQTYTDATNIARICEDNNVILGPRTVIRFSAGSATPYKSLTITAVNRGRTDEDRLYTCRLEPKAAGAKATTLDYYANQLRSRFLQGAQVASIDLSVDQTLTDNLVYTCLPGSDISLGDEVRGENIVFVGPSSRYTQSEQKTEALPEGTVNALVAAPENPVAVGVRGRETQRAIELFLDRIAPTLLEKIKTMPLSAKKELQQLDSEAVTQDEGIAVFLDKKDQQPAPLDLKHVNRLIETCLADALRGYKFAESVSGKNIELQVSLSKQPNPTTGAETFALEVQSLTPLPQSHIDAIRKALQGPTLKNLAFVSLQPFANPLRSADQGKRYSMRVSIPVEKQKVDGAWIRATVVRDEYERRDAPAPAVMA
ncbi:MAG TPA: hypothetical protein VFG51_02210 [Candidatus Saccharimonadia bacterium]|nr:hypothetical protein [Candidatus Saccharimonadia bacterium]